MTTPQIQNDNWMSWEFWDEEDFYGLMVHDKTYLNPKNQTSFKKEYYLKILIPEEKCVEGKFPSLTAHTELRAIEEALVKLLSINLVDCKNVNWCTYYGAKRLVYEVNDLEDFEKCVEHWKGLISPYELEIIEDSPWSIYKELEPDDYAWLQHDNERLVEVIRSRSNSPDKEHSIEFGISGSKKNLEKIAEKLNADGGTVIHLSKDHLEVVFDSSLESDEINGLSYLVFDACQELSCQYDGWSTKMRSE